MVALGLTDDSTAAAAPAGYVRTFAPAALGAIVVAAAGVAAGW
ncbi:MAG TPA: hypothetical protein VMU66_02625 [Gaiellales bacterium]|nr:hypothetical protein [Gaiellales bacterium]